MDSAVRDMPAKLTLDADGYIVARCPSMPESVGRGTTFEEALTRLGESIDASRARTTTEDRQMLGIEFVTDVVVGMLSVLAENDD